MKKRLVCFLYFKNISLAFNHTRCGCQKNDRKGKITDILQKEMQRAVRQKENVNILK